MAVRCSFPEYHCISSLGSTSMKLHLQSMERGCTIVYEYRNVSGHEKNLFENLMLALDFSIGQRKRRIEAWFYMVMNVTAFADPENTMVEMIGSRLRFFHPRSGSARAKEWNAQAIATACRENAATGNSSGMNAGEQ